MLSLVVGLGAVVECAALEWQPIGPGGGVVATIAVDPRRPATVYAGMARHGLYRSPDGGEHWTLLGFRNDWVSVVAFHPTEPDTLFVGTIGNHAGLMRSLDRGATWTRFGTAIGKDLVFDPADPETMYIGQDGCVFRTEGTGSARTWSPWCGGGLPSLDPIRALYFSARDRDTIFALTATHGLMESRNRGETWRANQPPLATSRDQPEISLATVSLSSPPVVYAVTVAAHESPVVKSTDGGRSWQKAGHGLPERPQALAVAPSDADVVYAVLARRLFMTSDGGVHWSAAEAGLPQSLAAVVTVDPRDPRTVYAGTYGAGVFKTRDGGTSWRRISIGLDASLVTAVITAPWPHPALFALTTGGGPLVTTDGGLSWRSLMVGLPPASDDLVALAADPTRPGSVYIGTHEGVFQSDDLGITWAAVAPHTLRTGVVALVVDPTPPRAVYAGLESGDLVRQRGDGPWSFLRPVVANRNFVCGTRWFVTPLVVDPRHPGTIYWGRARTLDDGGSWTDLAPPGGFASAIAADPTEDRGIYAADTLGSDGRVFRRDGAARWVPPGAGLPEGSPNALVVDPHDPATVYVAKGRGIYVSYDRAREWRALDTEVSGVPVLALALDPVDRRVLYAGTEGRGVLKTRLPPALAAAP